MWNNYIILMIRSYKPGNWFSIVSLLGIVATLGLVILLINSLMVNYSITLLFIVLMIIFVVTIAYSNYIALQLRKRTKEIYLRVLLGAKDSHIVLQLLMESVVLSGFLIVSGLVLSQLLTPYCENILGMPLLSMSFFIWQQVLIIVALILPIGLLGPFVSILGVIKYVRINFTKLSHRKI